MYKIVFATNHNQQKKEREKIQQQEHIIITNESTWSCFIHIYLNRLFINRLLVVITRVELNIYMYVHTVGKEEEGNGKREGTDQAA